MTNDSNADRAPGASASSDVTDLVIREFPDEALMRRRAYTQTVNRGKMLRRPGMLGPERKA